MFRLRRQTIRRIYEHCQKCGPQQLLNEAELTELAKNTLLGCLVCGTAFVYNPNGRRILKHCEVREWDWGRAIVELDQFYPQDHIRINGEVYYLDMLAFTDSDFEEDSDRNAGETGWHHHDLDD